MTSRYYQNAKICLICFCLIFTILSHDPAFAEDSYSDFASLEAVDFKLLDAYSDAEMDNSYPAFGSKYKEIGFFVTISVAHAGLYRVALRYDYAQEREKGSTPLHMVEAHLPTGQHVLELRFKANELKGSYGFWSPAAVNGVADVQLSYLAERQQLLDKIANSADADTEAVQRFLEDETRANTAMPVNKFIEKRLFSFEN